MDKTYFLSLENDSALNIRVPKALRDAFNEHCKKHMLNSSAVLRALVIDYLAEQDKKDNKQGVYCVDMYIHVCYTISKKRGQL